MKCNKCSLSRNRKNIVNGRGNKKTKVIIVGISPTSEQDEMGSPIAGKYGLLLTRELKNAGIDINDIYVTNIVKCRQSFGVYPKKKHVDSCIGFLKDEIREIRPMIVAPLGMYATKILFETFGMDKQAKEKSIIDTFGLMYLPKDYSFFIVPLPNIIYLPINEQIKEEFRGCVKLLKIWKLH